VLFSRCQFLTSSCDDRKDRRVLRKQFCKARRKEREAQGLFSSYKGQKEQIMEYLILIAVVSVMALYASIIVACIKQAEW